MIEKFAVAVVMTALSLLLALKLTGAGPLRVVAAISNALFFGVSIGFAVAIILGG